MILQYNVQLFYRIPSHCVIQSRDIYTRIYTHLCMHTEFAPFPWRSEKLARYPIPFPDRTLGVPHNSTLTPLSTLIPPGVMHVQCLQERIQWHDALHWLGAGATEFHGIFTERFVPYDSRHCLRKLCADTSHSFPESQSSIPTGRDQSIRIFLL